MRFYLRGSKRVCFGKRKEGNKVNSLFLFDSYVKISSIVNMVKYSLLFVVLLVTTTYAQIGSDGTGTVNGYYIGPGADLTDSNLLGADLRYADLSGADLTGADLSGATFTGVISGNITGTPTLLSPYIMAGGYIVGPYANLTGADLSGADLSGADLRNADLRYADLSSADLRNADLSFADLSGANLSNAKVNHDEFNGEYMNYPNNFPYAIFTNVISQSDYDALVAERDAALAAQATAEAERDARPTQAAYNTVVAERDARLTMDEVRDARVGSTMIEVSGAKADITMTLEETSDLTDWTNATTSEKTIEVNAPTGTRFFRFKMTE